MRLRKRPERWRATLVIPFAELCGVMARLIALDDVELTEPPRVPPDWQTVVGAWSERAGRYRESAQRATGLMGRLDLTVQDHPPTPETLDPRSDLTEMAETLDAAAADIETWWARRDEREERIARLERQRTDVASLRDLELPLEEIAGARFLYVKPGTVSGRDLGRLEVRLARKPVLVLSMAETDDRAVILAATLTEHAPVLEHEMQEAGVDLVDLPSDVVGKPEETLQAIDDELERLTDRNRVEREREELVHRWGERLHRIRERARRDRIFAEIMTRSARRGDLFMVGARLPDCARESLERATSAACLVTVVPAGTTAGEGR